VRSRGTRADCSISVAFGLEALAEVFNVIVTVLEDGGRSMRNRGI